MVTVHTGFEKPDLVSARLKPGKYRRGKTFRSGTCLLHACLLVLSFTLLPSAHSHPELELRIQSVTEEIEANPGDAQLLVFRGELHAEHEDWDAALYDFDLAANVDPSYIETDYHRGRLLYTVGEYTEAEYALEIFIGNARRRDDPSLPTASAHLILGELMEATGRWQKAAAHYDRGIRLAPRSNPGFYIARARSLVNADGSNRGLALRGLDERLNKSPGLHTLQEYAITLELERGNVPTAPRHASHT